MRAVLLNLTVRAFFTKTRQDENERSEIIVAIYSDRFR